MKYSKTIGSVALSTLLLMGLSGCGSDSNPITAVTTTVAEPVITPYTRVAVMAGTWAEVPGIAEKIAQYVVNTDEQAALGLPSNWVIAGANTGAGEVWEPEDLLPIPGMGSAVTGTARVIEFCNKAYALQAVGTGRFHGSALPCEVSVHSDGTNIYVDMLDAGAIFNIFFTDATDNFDAAQNAAFAEMAAAVKSELRIMIKAGLSDGTAASGGSAAVAYTESFDELGPQFTQAKIDNDIALRSPYIVYKYSGTGTAADGSFVKGTDDKALAASIIHALGMGATGDTANFTPGLEGLSAGSLWRSGRPDPIAIPNVQVVEACSPKYAKKATALGNEYITALPCEFTVYVDETDDTNQTIAISFLNPNFMFGTMFEGAVANAYNDAKLTKAEVIEYSTLADVVFGDLRMIVDHAVQDSAAQHNLGLTIK
ncbi:MAG TPA: DUF302 domain-containing protein [Ghiorsea sp.]|nr:DUF302 domain-containing protein [Ghiorsea sp.]